MRAVQRENPEWEDLCPIGDESLSDYTIYSSDLFSFIHFRRGADDSPVWDNPYPCEGEERAYICSGDGSEGTDLYELCDHPVAYRTFTSYPPVNSVQTAFDFPIVTNDRGLTVMDLYEAMEPL